MSITYHESGIALQIVIVFHALDGLWTRERTIRHNWDNRAFNSRENWVDQLFAPGRGWLQAGKDETILKRTDYLVRVRLIFVIVFLHCSRISQPVSALNIVTMLVKYIQV